MSREENHSESEYVKVTAPEESESEHSASPPKRGTVDAPHEAHELKHELHADAHEPLHERVPTPLHAHDPPAHAQEGDGPLPRAEEPQREEEQEPEGGRETPELRMPGSFDVPEAHHQHHHWEGGLIGLLKKMHLRQ